MKKSKKNISKTAYRILFEKFTHKNFTNNVKWIIRRPSTCSEIKCSVLIKIFMQQNEHLKRKNFRKTNANNITQNHKLPLTKPTPTVDCYSKPIINRTQQKKYSCWLISSLYLYLKLKIKLIKFISHIKNLNNKPTINVNNSRSPYTNTQHKEKK